MVKEFPGDLPKLMTQFDSLVERILHTDCVEELFVKFLFFSFKLLFIYVIYDFLTSLSICLPKACFGMMF